MYLGFDEVSVDNESLVLKLFCVDDRRITKINFLLALQS